MSGGSPRLLRTLNERAAMELLIEHGPLTRAEVEELTGLSKASVAEVLRRLETADLVHKAGSKPSAAGPPAQLWAIQGTASLVVGIDVTPKAIDVAVADLAGQVRGEARVRTPKKYDAVAILSDAVATACTAAGVATDDVDQVVIGMPGVVDPHTGQLTSVLQVPSWSGFHVLNSVQDALGIEHVRIENDVNLVALEELAKGAARGTDTFVLLWIGEGVGAGLVLRGQLWRGATGRGGELSSLIVPDPVSRSRVYDEQGGPLEGILDARALLRLATAHELTAQTPVDAVRTGFADPGRYAGFLDDLASRIAVALINVVGMVDPELVVLGGPVGQTGGAGLCELLTQRLAGTLLARTPIVTSAVQGNPVRAGALEFGLSFTRDRILSAGTAGR
ncbi:ROK family protein [Kribbella sp. NPDC059898]|uniref:ROK family transcriptional regulator n=1 Tax=Kribbella sp. NPDC059898 TaxID=3346995 RepID=UPI0036651BE1